MAEAAFDISGLKPLDATGLAPVDTDAEQANKPFDVRGLKLLDVSGLKPFTAGRATENPAFTAPDEPSKTLAPSLSEYGVTDETPEGPTPQPVRDVLAAAGRGAAQGFGTEPVGFSDENRVNYPKNYLMWQPVAAPADVALRAPGAAIGALSSAASEVYRQFGGSDADAARLDRDLRILGQGALVESGMGGHHPVGYPKTEVKPLNVAQFLERVDAVDSPVVADFQKRTLAQFGMDPAAIDAMTPAGRQAAFKAKIAEGGFGNAGSQPSGPPRALPAPETAASPATAAPPAEPIPTAAPPSVIPERDGLLGYGYTDAQIEAMSPAQRAAEYQNAVAAGAVAPPAPVTPPAPPVVDVAPAAPVTAAPVAAPAAPPVSAPVPAPEAAATAPIAPPPASESAPPPPLPTEPVAQPVVAPEPPPVMPSGHQSIAELLADPRSAKEIRADMEAAKAWQPTEDWQPVPRGAALDPTLEVRALPDGGQEARIAPEPGSRAAPVQLETPEDVTLGAERTAQPTPGQAEAGNYAKRHLTWNGLDITVETEAGQARTGLGPDGVPWSVTLDHPYGYLKGTKGRDGDHLDLYIGPHPDSPNVYVFDQVDPDTRKPDEHKLVIGARTAAEAQEIYHAGFSDGSGPMRWGAVTEMSVPEFKTWLDSGNTKKPLAYAPKPVAVPKEGAPKSLFQFLASRGGIRDHGGELAHMELTKKFVPGYGRLVRSSGMDLDTAREAAAEAGYPIGNGSIDDRMGTTTVRDFLDVLAHETAGNRVYTETDQSRIAERDDRAAAKEDVASAKEVEAEVRDVAKRLKVTRLTDDEVAAAVERHIRDGVDVEDALADVLERSSDVTYDENLVSLETERADHGLAAANDSAGAYAPRAAVAGAGERAGAEPATAAGNPPRGIEPRGAEHAPAEGRARGQSGPVEPGADLEIPDFLRRVKEPAKAPEPARAAPPLSNVAEEINTAPLSSESAIKQEADKRWRNWTPGKNAAGQTLLTRPRLTTFIKEVRKERRVAEREEKRAKAIEEKKAAQAAAKEQRAVDRAKTKEAPPPKPAEPQENLASAKPQAPEPRPEGGVSASEAKSTKPAEPPRPALELSGTERGPIQDFGEKIEGARKDTFAGFRDSLREELNLVSEPLSKSFPQPNYEKLAASGVSKRVLAHIAIMRDMIPNRPRMPYKAKRWAAQVETLRTFARQLLDGEISAAKFEEAARKNHVLDTIPLTAEAIEGVAPADLPRAAQYRVNSGSYSMLNGQRYSPSKTFWFLESPDRRSMRNPLSNDPANPYTFRDNPKEAVALASKIIAKELEAKPTPEAGEKSKYTDVGVFRDRTTKETFLGFKVRSSVIRLKAGFEDVKTAREYLSENRDEIQSIIDEMRKGPNMRGTENRARSGESLREGDVSPDTFSEAFGFRGVQFGNYVEGARRQADLNRAFDALMDLADVLGIPPRALSLNGELGLAFGARGHGGRDAAAAHYEPGRVVINLTKGGGPGSLAHEWLHALDNYFARQDKAGGYMSTRQRETGPVRDEVYKAWKGVEGTLEKGSFADRSSEFDKARSKPYFGTTIEKAARAFERYIVDRLSEKGAINDYLANIDTSGGAYPTAPEMKNLGIRQAFDNLFDKIETRKTDRGVEMFALRDEKPAAPPFYSAVAKAIENVKLTKAPPAQWINTIRNAPGVKPEELQWLGLNDWLKEQTGAVTKERVADYVRANQIEVKEVEKGGKLTATADEQAALYAALDRLERDGQLGDPNAEIQGSADDLMNGALDGTVQAIGDIEGLGVDERLIAPFRDRGRAPTKFFSYTLPGGENYRELLLTLPEKPTYDQTRPDAQAEKDHVAAWEALNQKIRDAREELNQARREMSPAYAGIMDRVTKLEKQREDLHERMVRETMERLPAHKKGESYKSPHFDEPNVLAHVRFNDRTIDGKRTLFIEEVQSDWGQAGKRKGFGPAEGPAGWGDSHGGTAGGVPRAPFVGSTEGWAGLALKRMIRYAAENGYDKIAWTPGSVQADRYDLSKHIKLIVLRPEQGGKMYHLEARGVSGESVLDRRVRNAEELADYIGKDPAEKLFSGENKEKLDAGASARLEGLDLKVGGEGMKGFYDQILPATVNKLVKKFGGRVGTEALTQEPDRKAFDEAVRSGDSGAIADASADKKTPVHTLDITPSLREAALGEGFPLFKRRAVESTNSPATGTDIATALRAELDRMGLKDVALELPDRIERYLDGSLAKADASYLDGVIRVALDTANKAKSLNHEAVHAIRDMGLFTDGEWGILSRAADKWRAQHNIDERYSGFSDEARTEEGVAHAYADWANGKPVTKDGRIARLFRRIREFFERIGNVLRGKGFKTAEDVFRSIKEGEVGARPREAPRGNASEALAKREGGDLFKTEPGAEGKPQTVIPGAEKISDRQFAERKAAEPLKPTKEQKTVGDLPLFSDKPAQGEMFALRHGPIAEKVGALRTVAEKAMELADEAMMKVAPMAVGSMEAQAAAKDYANAVRQARHQWSRRDDLIKQNFTPEQRGRMWEAADKESVALQQGKGPKAGEGKDALTDPERKLTESLQDEANRTWAAAQDVGIVEGEGLPSYVPRMMVLMNEAGGFDRPPRGEGYSGNQEGIGRGFRTTTGQTKQRKHMTAEETEAAMKARFGPNAKIAKDIRALALGTAKLQEAIAARALVNKIKSIGNMAGEVTVSEGAEPTEGRWFTLDHPAFKTYRPVLKKSDTTGKWENAKYADGTPAFERVPIYIRSDFKGPLLAVLGKDNGKIYNGLMALKGKAMSMVMYSPVIHNMVEYSRALPAYPLKVASTFIYFEGNRAKHDPAQMREAINAGLVPIGKRFFNQDITSVMEEPTLAPGQRSWTAQVLGFVPGLFDRGAGDRVKGWVDKAGDFWHNKLLWDRVADLQMGLYVNMRRDLVAKGHDAQTASRVAAHFANRYAGALPIEAMSSGARKLANMVLFSRTFTFGNLGAMKDMLTGLPRDVQAQIMRDAGPEALGKIKTFAKRKSMAILMLDIALGIITTSLMQDAFKKLRGEKDWFGENGLFADYYKRFMDLIEHSKDNPADTALHPINSMWKLSSTASNEPRKREGMEARVLLYYDQRGRAVYGRNPMGKIGEEFTGWPTAPGDMILRKLGTFTRPALQVMMNDKYAGAGFDRPTPIWRPNPEGAEWFKNAGRIAKTFAEAQLPSDALRSAADMMDEDSKKDPFTSKLKILAPLGGISVSQGHPGGKRGALADERRRGKAIDKALSR